MTQRKKTPFLQQDISAVIGLEIHCQLKTNSKIFARASYSFQAPPNSQIDEITLGLPGVMPSLNGQVIEFAVRGALALNCTIEKQSKFDRKHYYYPDLPKGYQISQYDEPYARNGYLDISDDDQSTAKKSASKLIRIERIHLEEDAGRLIHHASSQKKSQSWVDLNRAGVALIEIVTHPDLTSAQEAVIFLQKLRSILRTTGITDANMEEGSLRCDANVSIRKDSSDPLGNRVEIKNLNSFKAVRAAIEYQISEQSAKMCAGEAVIQSTVLWNAEKGWTRVMRTKEDADDYRYFPEPDLPRLVLSEQYIEAIRQNLPESPDQKKMRYQKEMGLPKYDAAVLVDKDLAVSCYFEKVVELCLDAKLASNWVKDEVLGIINKEKIKITDFKCPPERLAVLINKLKSKEITSPMAKKIFVAVYQDDIDVDQAIKKLKLKTIDQNEIAKQVERVIKENNNMVDKILAGNDRVKGFLVGQAMKATNGQADPQLVNRLIDQKIQEKKK